LREKLMTDLIKELQNKIIDTLKLEDVSPADIGEEDQLVGGELGLDSIDVLELVIMIEKDYAVKIDNKELGARVFVNLKTLATHIREMAPEGIF
jgi:acyl carrier protein